MNEDQISRERENPADPWVDMLIGRQWEIYWEHNSDYEDDWYDARIEAFVEQTPEGLFLFQVSFVGEDQMYEMTLAPGKVRPRNGKAEQSPSTMEWAQALEGKEVEIFWHAQGEGRDTAKPEEAADEAGWYLANVLGFEQTREDSGIFKVQFEGEDDIYEMPLKPELVRPSALAWVKRTLALLQLETTSFREWLQALPHDTRTLDDNLDASESQEAKSPEEVVEDSDRVRHWLGLIRTQLYLRTRLAPIEQEEHRRALNGTPAPTEAYVDFLVQCLKKHEDCALWYLDCERLVRDANETTTEMGWSSDSVFETVLKRGCENMEILLSMDTSVSGSKRKSKSSPNERRVKRRRKAIRNFWTPERQLHDEFDAQELTSHSVLHRFADQTAEMDGRWYVVALVEMLKKAHISLIAPLQEWNWRVQYCLGERDELFDKSTTSSEDATDQEMDEDTCHENSTTFLSYDQVNSLIHQAKSDRLLSKFDLDVSKLWSRLEFIAEFEQRGMRLISSVLDEPSAVLDKMEDSLFLQLQQLLKETFAPELMHINPLGKSQSSLSRDVIRNALTYREWFLDFRYAETQRERVALIESVVTRLSHLPPIDSNEISQRLDEISSRVKALSARCVKHLSLFDRISTLLCNRDEEARQHGLLTERAVVQALEECRDVGVLSVAEEKLVTRLDLLRWEQRAKFVLALKRPVFADVESLHVELEALLGGNSVLRVALTKGKRQNDNVDTEIRNFVKCDDDVIIQPLTTRLRSIYVSSSSWKERAESLVGVLRAFGNKNTGGVCSQQKPAAMVDIRRIADLLNEYENLEVDVTALRETLRRVYDDAMSWSLSITAILRDPNQSFEACFEAAQAICLNRPKGIIVDPTRQVYDLLVDLLQWYIAVKTLVESDVAVDDEVASLLLQGIDVVRRYSERRLKEPAFSVDSNAANFILAHISTNRPSKPLLLIKLENADLPCCLLNRMTDETQDEQGSYPLLSLLLWLWLLHLKVFIKEASGALKPTKELTLARARKLLAEQPVPFSLLPNRAIFHQAVDDVEKLKQLIRSAEQTERSANELHTATKNLSRVASSNEAAVRSHHQKLKDIVIVFKNQNVERKGIILDRSLESQVEHDLKIFSWLVRTFPYPILHSHDPSLWRGENVKHDPRIPWDVLVSLLNQSPSVEQEQGDLACIRLRVRELHDEATKWQEEISSLTMLSLRGGKRRSPGYSEEAKDSSSIIDMKKVEELCGHSILEKVLLPREAGIKHMLRRSKDFELALFEFLGKDYDGLNADKAAFPESGSLVAGDGSFLPLRLTGSILYQDMMCSIASISQIAGDVFANTPGKAAFDWICSAVSWIESLKGTLKIVPRDSTGKTEKAITISKEDALRLLIDGDVVFGNVPEDLRRTLSDHKIYISSTKEGKLTVKSRKGGAHHALGVVAVRWCPLLYESLKSDVATLNEWERSLYDTKSRYLSCVSTWHASPDTIQGSTSMIFGFREALTDLIYTLSELVIMPSVKNIESVEDLLNSIESELVPNMNVVAATAHFNQKYMEGSSVIETRFDCLHALAARQVLTNDQSSLESSVHEPIGLFGRVTARKLLLTALRKGIVGLGIPDDEASLFLCSCKAWDIENAACDLLIDGNSDIMSSEYKEKIRAIKRSLEDTRNKLLHAKVLFGEITPDKLVTMSVEALANPVIKKQRADAEAKQNSILIAPLPASTRIGLSAGQSVAQNSDITGATVSSDLDSSIRHENTKTHLSSNLSGLRDLARANHATRKPPPPPPPLLLVPNLHTTSESEVNGGYSIKHTGGGNEFRVTVGTSYSFMAEFYADGRSDPHIPNFLPEQLIEKKRSPWEVLDQFLREKLRSGKYKATTLRMTPCSDKDTQILKSFYKDYERRDRVAVFQVKEEKLYFITPKFQSLLRDAVHFEKIPATYVVFIRAS